jgi:hypothetical protein
MADFLFAPIRGGPEELHDHRNVAQKTKITIGVEERRGPVEFGGFPNPLDFPFEGQQVIIVQNRKSRQRDIIIIMRRLKVALCNFLCHSTHQL